ncbi:MAG: hypothetical protein ABW154_07765 [Dyella sp.]
MNWFDDTIDLLRVCSLDQRTVRNMREIYIPRAVEFAAPMPADVERLREAIAVFEKRVADAAQADMFGASA